MKNRWMIFGLGLSLAFNLTFLGAYGYRLWEKRGRHRAEVGEGMRRQPRYPEERGQFWKNLPPEQKKLMETMRKEFFPRLHGIRTQLMDERKALGSLLMQDNPDTVEIGKRLNRIGELQSKIERLVMFQLVKETESMEPRQREKYIRMIIRRMGERGPGGAVNPPRHPDNPNEKKPKEKKS